MHLLFEYREIFARNMKDIKTFQGYQVELTPKNPDVSSYTRQYKLRQDENDETDRQIQRLLKNNLNVENDDCRFNSPFFRPQKGSKYANGGGPTPNQSADQTDRCCTSSNR